MRKLFYLFLMCSSVLWSCNKGNEVDDPEKPDETVEVNLNVSVDDIVFDAQGGEQDFRIECFDTEGNACEWTVTGGGDWCEVGEVSGNGKGVVTVTVGNYVGSEDRNVNLTIKVGEKTHVVTVTQKYGDAIVLSKDKFNVPDEGGEVVIAVKSNIEYEVEIPEEFREWIELLPESKALTERSYTFWIAENESEEKREGYIVFKGNSQRETIRIYQAPKGVLVLSERAFHVPAEGKEIAVELKTNLDYEVQILDNASSWVTRLETKAVREDRLDFQIAANDKETERTARIAIKDKNSDLSDTVSLTQVPKGTYNGDLVWTAEFDLTEFHNAGHTKVMGNLVIQGDKIKDLKKLENCLTEVYGSVTLNCSSLFSLEGLYKLKKIAGDLIVRDGVITNWEGLRALETIGGNFEFSFFSTFSSFAGLESLETIGGDFRLIDSASLSTLASFSGLNSLKSIGGDFELRTSSLNDLSSFEGLESLETIGGSFKIIASAKSPSKPLPSFTSFNGLGKLKSIGGNFEVNASYSSSTATYQSALGKLSSFEGLESLETIGGNFKISVSLSSFSGLGKLKSIGGDFEAHVSYNSSFAGLENLETIGGNFEVLDYNFSSFSGLGKLKSIGGDFKISGASNSSSLHKLSSFAGLESLETIGGSFKVIASSSSSYALSLSSLTSFSGLGKLKSIGGDFEVSASSSSLASNSSSLDKLSSFAGLESLEMIGGNFKVHSSSSSSTSTSPSRSSSSSLSSLTSFSGLDKLKYIGGDFEVSASSSSISYYSHTTSYYPSSPSSSLNKLSSFEGLKNLEIIGGNFKVYASSSSSFHSSSNSLSSLISFSGLDKLKSIGGDFEVISSSTTTTTTTATTPSSSLKELSSFTGLESLEAIGGSFKVRASSDYPSYSLSSLTSFSGLDKLKSIGGQEFSITGCKKLYDFCDLKNTLQNMNGTYTVGNNGYNPTQEQILNGECSQTPAE